MKILNTRILLFFVCIGLFTLNLSCEDVQPEVYNGTPFVSFTTQQGTISVNENESSRDIEVGITRAYDTDVTVNLSVTDDTAIEGVDYTLSSQTVTIPAGEFTGSFSISPVDNDVFNPSKSLKIEISQISVNGAMIGNANPASYIKTVLLVNDDCPSQSNLWWGNLLILDPGYADISGIGSSNNNGDCDVLLIDADLSGFGAYQAPFELFFTPAFEGATNGTVNLPAQTYCTACSGGLDAILTGSGTYDEASETIILFWSLDRTDGASFGTGTHIITPN